MITFRFITWLIVTSLAIISASFDKREFPTLIIVFLLCLPIISLSFLLINKRNLSISLQQEDIYVEYQMVQPRPLFIQNRNKVSTVELNIYDEMNQRFRILIAPNRESVFWINQLINHIGITPNPDVSILLYDPLKFFTVSMSKKMKKSSFDVYGIPQNVLQNDPSDLSSREGETLKNKPSFDQSLEVSKIKELEPGDTMHRIHWKISARFGEWMVKQYDQSKEKTISYYFDLPIIKNFDENTLQLRDTLLQSGFSVMSHALKNNFAIYVNYQEQAIFSQPNHSSLLQRHLGRYSQTEHVTYEHLFRTKSSDVMSTVFSYQLTSDLVDELIYLKKQSKKVLFYYFGEPLSTSQQFMIERLKSSDIQMELLYETIE